ncbi:Germin-like protein subfamily 1 member 17 [Capsicum chinense]|nr:Germin-like protein subfamily 1 member 17 [Capsicum chinense]
MVDILSKLNMTSPKDTNLFPNILKIEFATTMSMNLLLTTLAILASFESQLAYAYDLHPLQDICVAVKDPNTSVFMNGKFCKDPNLAKVDDFFASGLNISGNAVPKFGIFAKLLDVNTIPGLNTLGISIARGDFEPK